MKLHPTEKELRSWNGIRTGNRVKIKDAWFDRARLGGVSSSHLLSLRGIVLVKKIVVSRKHGWNSAQLAWPEGHTAWMATEDLVIA